MGQVCLNAVKNPQKLGSVRIQLVFRHHQGTLKTRERRFGWSFSQNPEGYSTNSLNLLPQSTREEGKNSLHLSQLCQRFLQELVQNRPGIPQEWNQDSLGNLFCSLPDTTTWEIQPGFHNSHLDSQTPIKDEIFPKKLRRGCFSRRKIFPSD